MKTLSRAAGTAFLAIVLAVSAAAAQDMTGTWVLSVTLDAGSGDATFELVQDGDSITGTYSGALGSADVTGSVADGKVTLEFGSEAGQITYTGTVEDGVYSGTCNYGQVGAGTFEGSKT